jgi:hypothetical protein
MNFPSLAARKNVANDFQSKLALPRFCGLLYALFCRLANERKQAALLQGVALTTPSFNREKSFLPWRKVEPSDWLTVFIESIKT